MMQSGGPKDRVARQLLAAKFLGPMWYVVAVIGLTAAGSFAYSFVRAHGAAISGDEPHYLVVAKALAHGSLHPLPFYETDIHTHALFDWSSSMAINPVNLHLYSGPHGLVSNHGLGLPLLLAPFVAVGGKLFAFKGLLFIEAIGCVYCLSRATRLARCEGKTTFLSSTLFVVGPAVWVAATGIYPDFLAGICIACAACVLLVLQLEGALTRVDVAAGIVGLALLPWLHIKNAAPAAALVAVLLVIGWRTRNLRAAGLIAGAAVLAWLALAAYNLRYFGRIGGLPQPLPNLGRDGLTLTLGLLLDRHQGLLVQVPTVMIGLAGMWAIRCRAQYALAGMYLSVLSILVLNGTFVAGSYGGATFAGRYQWTLMLPLLTFVPFYLAQLVEMPRRLLALTVLVGAGWLVEGGLVLVGHHAYFNAADVVPPWDPSTYPGWWGALNPALPELFLGGGLFGNSSAAFLLAVLLVAAFAAILVTFKRRSTKPRTWGIWAVVVGLLLAVGTTVSYPLPSSSLEYSSSDLGSPYVASRRPLDRPGQPLNGLGSGMFLLTTHYSYSGSTPATITFYCTKGNSIESPGPRTGEQSESLSPGSATNDARIRCGEGVLWFQVDVPADGALTVAGMSLSKVSN